MYIYGAGGHAKVIIEILEALIIPVEGVFDDAQDNAQIWQYRISAFPGNFQAGKDQLIIAIGNNAIRRQLAARLSAPFGTAVHPQANISPRAAIGEGTVMMAGVTVNADVQVGKHCIINTNASVDHDCVLEDYVHISPNAALCGRVSVGEGTQVGSGAVVIPGVKIGRWALIGAGAVVVRNVADGATVIGNPAKAFTRKLSGNDK